jgi:predicted O-linked N-acetylglucosamine transferase (SPINDLY family)
VSFERYSEWLLRGCAHQAQQHLVDALVCYRRALREHPHGADAQFHIGEIAWQMGHPNDAIAAWRSACALAPGDVASGQALALALAAVGDFDAGFAAVTQALALRPDEPRLVALSRLLGAARGTDAGDDASLARAVATSGSWPVVLLAAAVERALAPGARAERSKALPALLDAASRATVSAATADAWRRLARALALSGDAEAARAFADRYADACLSPHPPALPLLWPQRTAGDALRVGMLAAPGFEDEAASLREGIGDAMLGDAHFDVFMGMDAAFRTGADAGQTPPAAGEAAARAIAKRDLDVLIDLAGVRVAAGHMLALRPARAVWAVEQGTMPPVRRLADRVFRQDDRPLSSQLVPALRELKEAIAGSPRSAASASELAQAWERAVVSHREGDLAAALAGYDRVLDAQPRYAPGLYLAGIVARTQNEASAAQQRFRAAVEVAPRFVDARLALVDSLVDGGQAERAASVAREGLAIDAAPARLWRALGEIELARGDAEAALSALDTALMRDSEDGETHYTHGVALQTARRMDDAARAYHRALVFRPDLHAADFNLGVIFDQQGNAPAAVAAFSNVLNRAPDHVPAYKALAEVLLASGRIGAWLENFERFEQNCPDHLALAVHALEVCAYQADFARLERYLSGLRQGRYTADEAVEKLDALQQLLYLLHFFDVEPELLGRYAGMHDALATKVYGAPWPRRAQRRPGKLRIGYISGDFCNHVMGKMMLAALRHHDRERFDIAGYATVDARDGWTRRFEAVFSRFVPVAGLSDRAAAQRIAEDDLDLLVDLSTHTKGARPAILALKPARVQVTHVASAGTLAMSAIDYKLTDRYADAGDDAHRPIEPLLAMEGCIYPYRHIVPAATAAYSREALGISRDAVVIGAFSSPLKLSQRCLALWRDVLAAIPNAVLAFSPLHPALRAVFQRITAVAGIEPRRVVFVPQGRDDGENQARYRIVDFVLDPMPYGGVNGTLEALDMTVPVVTLLGARHAERTSYSILANLGVTDTVAHTGGDYVAIAVRLATDRAFMRHVRERIAKGLAHSALTDMEAHTRHLESAYVRALEASVPEALAGDTRR